MIITIGVVGLLTTAAVAVTLLLNNTSVGNDTASATQPAESSSDGMLTASLYQAPLEEMVHDFGSQYYDTIGLYVIDISDNAQASYNGSQQFVSASLYKLFVAYMVFDAVDSGEIALSDTVQDINASVEHCLNIMITISDNACAVALGKQLGWQIIDDRLQQEGYASTVLNNYDENGDLITDKLTTPEDVATLLYRLYSGDLLSSESTSQFMSLLENQTLNYALPTGLDDDISFAHKTGILDSVSHDAGFITYQGKVLLVVMMTDGWTYAYDQSVDRFTEFGKVLSAYIKTSYSS